MSKKNKPPGLDDLDDLEIPDAPSKAEGLGTVVVRNDFYRDGYRNMLRLSLVQGVVILFLIGAMYFVIHVNQPEDRYFATTEDGRLVPLVPLGQPNLSTPALTSWVAQAATEVMTFGFNDYQRRLQESSRHFTRRGWDSFTKALQEANTVDSIAALNQIVTAAPRSAPVILSEKLVNGRYEWLVQMPILLNYESGEKTKTETYVLTLKVVRVSRLESANGVGIEQWLAEKR
ncbi:type IVB secretion system apparatus protein IcmL/DotI [Alphaproteobacteria bacterium]|nr:type IVB secretion system apparatus protein IcmL/DotI [Alphaproteobacteria bacterium]